MSVTSDALSLIVLYSCGRDRRHSRRRDRSLSALDDLRKDVLEQTHRNGFRSRDLAALRLMPERNEHVAFGIIGRNAPAWDAIGDDLELAQAARDAIARLRHQRDGISCFHPVFLHVSGIHEHDVAAALDAAKA